MSQLFLSGPVIPAKAGKPDSLMVIFHGYGADGANLIDLGYCWQNELPGMEFIAPDAPDPCESGSSGYQWFSLVDWVPADPGKARAALTEKATQIVPGIKDYLARLLDERGLGPDRLVLGGFSQGAMLALMVGLDMESPCAGIISWSGALLPEINISTASKAPPVLLVHGDMDSVVPVQSTYSAREELEKAGINVSATIIPYLEHGIDSMGVEAGRVFLKKVLS